MGLIAQSDGWPRIAGRLMGLMVLEHGPLSFAELAERLQVSRGSISTNARFLESVGVIKKISLPGDRLDYYQLTENPYVKLLDGLATRMQSAEQTVRSTFDGISDRERRRRLRELADFYSGLVGSYRTLVKRMKDDL